MVGAHQNLNVSRDLIDHAPFRDILSCIG